MPKTEPAADAAIEVWISGRAWDAEPWGHDPHYQCDDPEMAAIVKAAQRVRHGRGWRVRISGATEAMEHLAHLYECDGYCWTKQADAYGDDGGETVRDGRACLDAARRIREAIEKVNNAEA